MGQQRYGLWFGRGVRICADENHVTVWVDGAFALDRLRSRHAAEVREAARQVLGQSASVTFRLDEAPAPAEVTAIVGEEAAARAAEETPIKQAEETKPVPARDASPRRRKPSRRGELRLRSVEDAGSKRRSALPPHSLRSFCVGPCNQFAATAARMIADQPGSASPVFLWGPSGTGKTHLLEAVRGELRGRHALRRVILLSAEEFTNDFMAALSGSGLPGFRRRYRDVDALLLDDVQFVAGKRATVRELQFTFDTLARTGCQMVFTADRPPLELQGLGSELAGRLAGGMVCGVTPLDDATRLQILRTQLEAAGVATEASVIERLALQIAGDGRLLSGVVCRLSAVAKMNDRAVTWEDVEQFAGDLLSAGRPVIGLSEIQRAVCDTFGLPSNALQSRGQQRSVSEPRMLAMYLARRHTRAAFSEIGRYFGDRSHSTVIAAHRRVEGWISTGSNLRSSEGTTQIRQALSAIESRLRIG